MNYFGLNGIIHLCSKSSLALFRFLYICYLMRTLISMLVLVLVVNQAHSQIGRDKVLHFAGGSLFGLAGAGIAKEISDGNRFWTFAGAVGGSLLVGLGKEAIDAGQSDNGWDNDDLLATVLGGVTVGIAIDIFTDHGRTKKRRAAIATRHPFEPQNHNDQLVEDFDFDTSDTTLPSLNYLSIPESLR